METLHLKHAHTSSIYSTKVIQNMFANITIIIIIIIIINLFRLHKFTMVLMPKRKKVSTIS